MIVVTRLQAMDIEATPGYLLVQARLDDALKIKFHKPEDARASSIVLVYPCRILQIACGGCMDMSTHGIRASSPEPDLDTMFPRAFEFCFFPHLTPRITSKAGVIDLNKLRQSKDTPEIGFQWFV